MARVQITIEITCQRPWAEGAKIEDVYRVAEREALETLASKLQNDRSFTLVGRPKIVAVLAESGEG